MNDVKNRNNTKKEIISNEILKNHKLFIKKPATDNQKKHSRRYNEICNTFSSYLSNSTLHGLYYVGNAQLSYGERLCWLISFLVALGCAIYFIINIYIKYTTNSLLLSLNPIPIPMKDIPFPAVTICNMNLANKNESLLIIKNGSDSEKSILDNICRIEDDTTAGEGTNGTSRWDELKNIMLKISQPCDKMLQMCRWHLRKMQCDEIFNVVATDEGLCCTFNMLPLNLILRNTNRTEFDSDYSQTVIDDWNPERGYTPDSPDDIYPFRSQGPGTLLGLRFLLDADVDNYYCTNSNSAGVKMILHNPSEIPQIEELGFMLPVGFELGVAFKPIIYDASPDIRSIDLQKRMCYFNDERFLKYYRTYSNANCKMECLVNKTIEQCGCVPYHYPKSDETRICHHVNDLCSMRVKDSMEALLSETDEKDFCDCLPSCFRLDFEKVISYAQIINKTRPPDHYLHNKSRTYIRNNIIAVDVYFEVTDFSRFTKNELYGSSDIIASVGGLLGLFLGFSILSIVEVLYYVTLKLWCKIVRDKKKEKIDNKIIPVMPLHKMAKLKY